MPAKRKHAKHLPVRMRMNHGAYYHVCKEVWTPLGRELGPALLRWAELEGQHLQGAKTVGDAIALYVSDALPQLAATTQKDYLRILGILQEPFGATKLSAVKPTHIAQYLAKRSSKVAANREMAVLSSVFSHAMRLGLANENPCRGVRRNRERARDRIPTAEELAAIRLAAKPPLRRAIDFSLMTAIRASDLCKLDIAAIRDGVLELRTGKTGQKLAIELSGDLARLVEEARGNRKIGPLLLTYRGARWTPRAIDSAWTKARAKAGVTGLHWHDLRAWALTQADEQGGREEARKLGSHKRASTTDLYLRSRERIVARPVNLKPSKK